jgi:3-hydroxyisobutyrate dehydrogenase-like beta-hydroxyacid dehydrogenase
MARQIVDAGFPTTLWARQATTLEVFADTAATVAANLRDLGAASDVLGVCVVDDTDVDEVLRGTDGALAGMAPGSVVVIHSTVHPETCTQLAADHPHLAFLDAPVSGGGHKAAAKELLVMVGGDVEVLDRCRRVLETFADPLVHVGPLGTGQVAKLINNALFTAQLGLAADVFGVGRARGIDPTALGAQLLAGSGRSYALEIVAGAGHTLERMAELAGPLLAKDVRILVELLAPSRPSVVDVATDALRAMGVDGP